MTGGLLIACSNRLSPLISLETACETMLADTMTLRDASSTILFDNSRVTLHVRDLFWS